LRTEFPEAGILHNGGSVRNGTSDVSTAIALALW
jgi:hypothetical protein